MKALLDSFVVAAYLFTAIWGGKFTLSYMTQDAQRMAFEKVASGLDDLTPITQRMTYFCHDRLFIPNVESFRITQNKLMSSRT